MGALERRIHVNEIQAEKEKYAITIHYHSLVWWRIFSWIIREQYQQHNIYVSYFWLFPPLSFLLSIDIWIRISIITDKSTNSQIISCTCPYFQQYFFPCKHMFYIELHDLSVTVRPQINRQHTWREFSSKRFTTIQQERQPQNDPK